jgi:hypothetical protein
VDAGLDSATLTQPLGFAHISVGAAPYLELGIDASASLESVLAGTSLLWASPIGSFAASGGVSVNFDETAAPEPGYAGQLNWRLAFPSNPYIPMLGAGIEYRSEEFSPPEEPAIEAASALPTTDSLLLSSQLSQSFPGGLGSLAIFGNMGFGDGELQSYSLSVGFFFHLSSATSLSASGGADWNVDTGLEPRASVSVSIVPKPRDTVQFRQDLIAKSESISTSNPLDVQQRLILSTREEGLIEQSEDARGAWISGTYTGDKALLSASSSYQATPQNGESQMALDFTASSTFAYAGGFFGASSNLGDAFLFLVPEPSLGTDTLVLQPSSGPAAVSEGGKPQLVPGLIPYEDIAASIEMPGSPAERLPQPGSTLIESAYRSGTVIRIGAAPAMSSRGRLLDQKGAVLPGRGGKFFRAEKLSVLVGSTFSDEKGIFECYGLEAGEYVVAWSDGSQSRFAIAGEGKAMIELGDVRAIPPTQGVKQ